MSTNLENPALATRAYKIFLSELSMDLRRLDELCSKDSELTQSEVQSLVERFHMLKGAAGMFGLKSLGEISAKLEIEMKHSHEELMKRGEQLRSLISEFVLAANDVPEPRS